MQIEAGFHPSVESMKENFIEWYNENVADFDVERLLPNEVYVVWFCYIVGNAKVLISTTRPDHMYYEVTWHDNQKRLYVDSYKKFRHDTLRQYIPEV